METVARHIVMIAEGGAPTSSSWGVMRLDYV